MFEKRNKNITLSEGSTCWMFSFTLDSTSNNAVHYDRNQQKLSQGEKSIEKVVEKRQSASSWDHEDALTCIVWKFTFVEI